MGEGDVVSDGIGFGSGEDTLWLEANVHLSNAQKAVQNRSNFEIFFIE